MKKPDKYPMCKEQPAQVDCRVTDCIYHTGTACNNLAPAITLHIGEKFHCWSCKINPNKAI